VATIRVKRGTTKPTTSNLINLGELAFDYSKNALYARGSSEVVKIGGELELVYSYEAAVSISSITYTFSPDYIYKIHIIASTQGTTIDSSLTTINYRSAILSYLYGSCHSVYSNDNLTTITKSTVKNTSAFVIQDAHSSGAALTSGITKVIDFELSPTYATSLTDIKQWVAQGRSVTTVTGQAEATITLADFVHSIFGTIGNLYINPGLNLGSPDHMSVSIYRTLRK